MYKLPENIRTALIQYLAQRPWHEVQEVIPAIANLEKIEEKKEEKK